MKYLQNSLTLIGRAFVFGALILCCSCSGRFDENACKRLAKQSSFSQEDYELMIEQLECLDELIIGEIDGLLGLPKTEESARKVADYYLKIKENFDNETGSRLYYEHFHDELWLAINDRDSRAEAINSKFEKSIEERFSKICRQGNTLSKKKEELFNFFDSELESLIELSDDSEDYIREIAKADFKGNLGEAERSETNKADGIPVGTELHLVGSIGGRSAVLSLHFEEGNEIGGELYF